ncbi:MAG: hypothetical protein ABI333_07260, partial [bacterium]
KRFGIWHRDISPSNVMIDGNSGAVKILHFGLCEPAGGAAFGDPWFLSPEQARGEPVNEQTTIYCLGALWFYAVCGNPVFQDADPAVVLLKHQSEGPQPPSSRRPGLPAAFDTLIARSLVKNTVGRFSTLGEMLAAAQALGGVPTMPLSSPARVPLAQPGPPSVGMPGDLGAAATMIAAPGAGPQMMAPQAAAPVPAPAPAPQPAPSPQASPAPQAAAPAPEPAPEAAASAGRRRKRKKGFRETLWFMKGDVEEMAAEGDVEKELASVDEGDGTIADREKGLDDRYRDDGSVTAEDRQKYSVKTGQTGMMPAYHAPTPMEEGSAADLERRKSIIMWLAIILVVFGGGGGAAAYFFVARPPATFIKSNLAGLISSQISDYKTEPDKPKLPAPPARELPGGLEKDLFQKLVETAAKPETYMPETAFGMVDYLGALEKRTTQIEIENKGKPRRKQVNLFKLIQRRGVRKIEKQYAAIKDKAVKFINDTIAAALKKGATDAQKTSAKRACVLALAAYRLDKERAALESSCLKVDDFFEVVELEKPKKPTDAKPGMDAMGAKSGMDAMGAKPAKAAMGAKPAKRSMK